MKIEDIMTRDVQTISADASAKEAARKMHDLHIGSLLVMEGDKLVGIITDRDICCKVVATGRDAVITRVNEAMVTELVTCYSDQEISEAAEIMSDRHIRRLTVLDRNNAMAGFLSVDDLARSSHELASSVLEAATPAH